MRTAVHFLKQQNCPLAFIQKNHAVATEERTKNTDADSSFPYGKLITVTNI